jgi:pyruvate,orthophosphate dikinase
VEAGVTLVYPFDHGLDLPLDGVKAILGGKAANIAVMVKELDLPVPPGFVITTDACRAYLEAGWPDGLEGEIREQMAVVEKAVGRCYGDALNPLLVSVRSGAPVSMPGMMDTILNLGLNEATVGGLAAVTGDAELATECHRRFLAGFEEVVGTEAPDDPWQQLRGAVEAVFRSWNGDRARSYRKVEGIPDDLGTAVVVQAMVLGNRGDDSGSGVIFTRNPATGENVLYGDVIFGAQGEDVVAGTHATEPIAALDRRMPACAAQLREYSDRLERHYTDVCDIEFTIEAGRLWMLQTRIGKRSPQAALRIAVEMADDPGFPLSRRQAVERVARYLADPPRVRGDSIGDATPIATGLGASPGVAAGRIATSADMAVQIAESGEPVVMVRRETSPDDVHGMARAAGILTVTGGLASHAAVVARGWGIPAVVGAESVVVREGSVEIDGVVFTSADTLTIDGSAGRVYRGDLAGESRVVPEASILLRWAEELGIDIRPAVPEGGDTPVDATAPAVGPGPAPGLVLRALLIKGFADVGATAVALRCSEAEAKPLLEGLATDGLAEAAGGMYQLTAAGRERAAAMIAADRASWGEKNADGALDTFHPLDLRMKQIVTAWQMKEVDGAPVLNDHTDADYDAAVLGDFAALAADTDEWLTPMPDRLPRLAEYRSRLAAAADRVASGDHAYIASPRVDSFHSIWFELHEDLILLAGRTREGETAAGRA